MPLDGNIGRLTTKVVQVTAAGHDPIILTGAIKQNQGLWAPGTILTREGGELSPWNGTGDPVGVLADQCDSSSQASANYVAHGLVVTELLKKADGSAPTQTEIYALHQITIYGA